MLGKLVQFVQIQVREKLACQVPYRKSAFIFLAEDALV